MCFSASASFAASAVLVPTGLYCMSAARRSAPRYLALATYPLFFGIQQALEGVIWLKLASGDRALLSAYALGYTFFAYFLWPALVPTTANLIGVRQSMRRIVRLCAVLGVLFGASLYLPLWWQDGWLTVSVHEGSIVYVTQLIYDGVIPRAGIRFVYALLIVLPLLMVRERLIQIFGLVTLVSVVIARIFFDAAFVSVWCFFAALLSLFIVAIIHRIRRQRGVANVSG
ncbi:MAG: hypothetical protein H6Q33_5284 [Deltaproteobacteria bacterium]|nr:hypothetical protein [Deltaproteobacteria bacterium]